MAKIDWNSAKKRAETEARNIKLSMEITNYIKNTPGEGYILNNLDGNILKISETRLSILNRLLGYIKRTLKIISSVEQKNILISKQKELEKEISLRTDNSTNLNN